MNGYDPAQALDALRHIDPGLPRDQWHEIGRPPTLPRGSKRPVRAREGACRP